MLRAIDSLGERSGVWATQECIWPGIVGLTCLKMLPRLAELKVSWCSKERLRVSTRSPFTPRPCRLYTPSLACLRHDDAVAQPPLE